MEAYLHVLRLFSKVPQSDLSNRLLNRLFPTPAAG